MSSEPSPRPKRRRARRGLLIALAVVLAGLVGGYWYERPLLLTATGYAAHNACALTRIAGRDNPATDLPPNPLVPYLRTSSTDTGVRAGVLGVLARQRALHTPGVGCTVVRERTAVSDVDMTGREANPFTSVPAPQADEAVAEAIATAFGEDLSAAEQESLGTRAIVVVRDGRIIGERYAPGFDATTPQLGWSMSKSVTSLMVGVGVQQGAVKLSDDHLRPEWNDARAAITVEQLLRMTSGLAWDETYDLGTPITRMLYLEHDMAGYVASQPLAHAPGTRQQYSSGSTTLLMSVLQQKTRTGPRLPSDWIFQPLGLTSAVFEADGTGTVVGSSYLWATPRDWAAIGQFALQDGVWDGKRLLPEGWMAQTTTVQPVERSEDPNYAAGWWTNKGADGSLVHPELPADAYWAQGHDGQRLYVLPSERLVVVRLGFSPGVDDVRTVPLVAALADG